MNPENRTLDPVLTTIAQEYSNSKYIGDKLFPVVNVSKQNGKIPIFGKSAFLVRDTIRGKGALSNRIPASEFSLEEYSTIEQDVEMSIDYLEEEIINDYFKFESRAVKELCDILNLGKEMKAAEIARNAGSYAAGMSRILTAEEAFDGFTSNPLEIIGNGKEAIRSKIGVYPNTMVISNRAYKALINNDAVKDKIKYTGHMIVNTAILVELLEINDIFIGRSIYSEDSNNFIDIWGADLILANVDKSDKSNRNEYNPSFAYTFQKNDMPEVDTYSENGGKIKVIRNTDNYCLKITCREAGYLIKNAAINP